VPDHPGPPVPVPGRQLPRAPARVGPRSGLEPVQHLLPQGLVVPGPGHHGHRVPLPRRVPGLRGRDRSGLLPGRGRSRRGRRGRPRPVRRRPGPAERRERPRRADPRDPVLQGQELPHLRTDGPLPHAGLGGRAAALRRAPSPALGERRDTAGLARQRHGPPPPGHAERALRRPGLGDGGPAGDGDARGLRTPGPREAPRAAGPGRLARTPPGTPAPCGCAQPAAPAPRRRRRGVDPHRRRRHGPGRPAQRGGGGAMGDDTPAALAAQPARPPRGGSLFASGDRWIDPPRKERIS